MESVDVPWAFCVGIEDWMMEALVSRDRRARKILAMNGCLHIGGDAAQLCNNCRGRKEKRSDLLRGVCREGEQVLTGILEERRAVRREKQELELVLCGESTRETDVAEEDSCRWLGIYFFKKTKACSWLL